MLKENKNRGGNTKLCLARLGHRSSTNFYFGDNNKKVSGDFFALKNAEHIHFGTERILRENKKEQNSMTKKATVKMGKLEVAKTQAKLTRYKLVGTKPKNNFMFLFGILWKRNKKLNLVTTFFIKRHPKIKMLLNSG